MIGRDEIRAFARSVDLGGFTPAARELDLTPSALSKLVSRLERRLGVRLLTRTTRRIAPTTEGTLFLARCRRILAEIEEAENELSGMRERPRGRLRMHVGVGFGTHQLVPAMPRFLGRYSELQVELVVEDRFPNFEREGIDISVWPGAPRDATLVARKLCEFERVICASPTYLARHGVPRAPEDLAKHNCIVISGLPANLKWSFDMPTGRKDIEIVGNTTANNAECVLRFARMGLGLVRLNEFIVCDDVRTGTLVPVLVDCHRPEPVPLYVHCRQARHRPARVGAMLDFLIEAFSHAPWKTATVTPKRYRSALRTGPA